MRQAKALALMITAVTISLGLCSCAPESGTPEKAAREIRVEYLAAEQFTMTIDVTADYGDKIYKFKMRWTGGAELGELEIIEPEIIRGLKAEISEKSGTLVFDGAAFDTGGLFGEGASPVEIAPLMIKSWKNGYISECAKEKLYGVTAIAITVEISDSERLITWFDSETHIPIRAELSENGYTAIFAEFGDVVLE